MATLIKKDIITFKKQHPEKLLNSSKFFKSASPDDYGYHDRFLGLPMPILREIVKNRFNEIENHNLSQLESVLMTSEYNEFRICGLLYLMSINYTPSSSISRIIDEIDNVKNLLPIHYFLIFSKKGYVNNWNLVDISSPQLLGKYIIDTKSTVIEYNMLRQWYGSPKLWTDRICIVGLLYILKYNTEFAMEFLDLNIDSFFKHDLIDKSIGWILRELFKRKVNISSFLEKHAHIIRPVTISYALEKCTRVERKLIRERIRKSRGK